MDSKLHPIWLPVFVFLTITIASCTKQPQAALAQEGPPKHDLYVLMRDDLPRAMEVLIERDQWYLHAPHMIAPRNAEEQQKREEAQAKQAVINEESIEYFEAILQHYGYPGKSLVGDSLSYAGVILIMNEVPWYRKGEYFETIMTAIEQGELAFSIAYLYLHNLMVAEGHEGLPPDPNKSTLSERAIRIRDYMAHQQEGRP